MKFYFKWKTNGKANNSEELSKFEVFLVHITQKEGEFAKASVKVNIQDNIFVYKGASIILESGNTKREIFKGVVINVPVNSRNDLVTIEMVARPEKYCELIEKISDKKSEQKYCNPLFKTTSKETKTLESRAALYYADKVSGKICTSDIVRGKKIYDLSGKYMPNSFTAKYVLEPLDGVDLTVKAVWRVENVEMYDIYHDISAGFDGYTLTAEDFKRKFNALVSRMKNTVNYTVLSSNIREVSSDNIFKKIGPYKAVMKKSKLHGELLVERVSYINREEVFHIRINNEHQSNKSGKVKKLEFNIEPEQNTQETEKLDSFFMTKDGREAVTHAIDRACAYLKFSSRAIYVSFKAPIEDSSEITTNDSVTFTHKLFGGSPVIGKVVKTELFACAKEKYNKITLAVSVGVSDKEKLGEVNFDDLEPKYISNIEKSNNKIYEEIQILNTWGDQASSVLSKEFNSIEDFNNEISKAKTELYLKLQNPRSKIVIESAIEAPDITFSSFKGVDISS